MQASTQTSTICTPTREQSATFFVAIELSLKGWLVCIHSPDRDRLSHYDIGAGDCDKLLALIEQARARVTRALGVKPEVVSCYEAGYDGFWLHRVLVAAGVKNHVFDPASIAVERRGRRVKTDRIDNESMIRTLMAYLRGEPRVVRVVRVPSPAQEDARRLMRERERLVKERTAHVNRIKSLLRTQGLAAGHPKRADWLTWLEAQCDHRGRPLGQCLVAELKRQHQRLRMICQQVKALEDERASAMLQALVTKATALTRLKGIGPNFATNLTGEVYWKDFENRRQVASYVGLAPSPWQSGGLSRDQGISKAGNRRARCTAIQLAWLWLRHQPDSELSQWYRARVGDARGRLRKIMIVALARKLVVALWRYLETGLVPTGAVFKKGK